MLNAKIWLSLEYRIILKPLTNYVLDQGCLSVYQVCSVFLSVKLVEGPADVNCNYCLETVLCNSALGTHYKHNKPSVYFKSFLTQVILRACNTVALWFALVLGWDLRVLQFPPTLKDMPTDLGLHRAGYWLV